jgi:outer membrane immunogenic protein
VKRILLATIGLVAFAATPALAADIPAKAPAYKATAFSWTGPYAGLSLGGRWAYDTFTAISIGGAPPPFAPTSRSVEVPAFRIGGYAGYNWQIAPSWLVGVEVDFAWANGSVTKPGVVGGTPAPVAGDSTKSDALWDGSIRGRAGFLATPTWLLYGTAGIAWQGAAGTTTCSVATCGGLGGTQTDSRTLTGWTVGGGIEGVLLANWLLRAEYRYSDYPTWRYTYFSGAAASVDDNKVRTHTALVGLGYKF